MLTRHAGLGLAWEPEASADTCSTIQIRAGDPIDFGIEITLEQRGEGAAKATAPSFFLDALVARRNFTSRFHIFLESSMRDGMTFRF